MNESNNGNGHGKERRLLWGRTDRAGLMYQGKGAGDPSDLVILGDQVNNGEFGRRHWWGEEWCFIWGFIMRFY